MWKDYRRGAAGDEARCSPPAVPRRPGALQSAADGSMIGLIKLNREDRKDREDREERISCELSFAVFAVDLCFLLHFLVN